MINLNLILHLGALLFSTKYLRASLGIEGNLSGTLATEIFRQGVRTGVQQTGGLVHKRGYQDYHDRRAVRLKSNAGAQGFSSGIKEGCRVASDIVTRRTIEAAEQEGANVNPETLATLATQINNDLSEVPPVSCNDAYLGRPFGIPAEEQEIRPMPQSVRTLSPQENQALRNSYPNVQSQVENLAEQAAYLPVPQEIQASLKLKHMNGGARVLRTDLPLEHYLRSALGPDLGRVPGDFCQKLNLRITGAVSKDFNTRPRDGWGYSYGLTFDLGEPWDTNLGFVEKSMEIDNYGPALRLSMMPKKTALDVVRAMITKNTENLVSSQQNQVSGRLSQDQKGSQNRTQFASLSSAASYHTECFDFHETSASAVTPLTQLGGGLEQQCYQVYQHRPLPEGTSGLTPLSVTSGVFVLGLSVACLVLSKVLSKRVEAQLFKVAEGKMTFHHPCSFSTTEDWIETPEIWFGLP